MSHNKVRFISSFIVAFRNHSGIPLTESALSDKKECGLPDGTDKKVTTRKFSLTQERSWRKGCGILTNTTPCIHLLKTAKVFH